MLAFEEAFECADLIDNAIGQFLRAHFHFAPAKALQIG
jgi:hypothetical protein